MVIEYLQYNMLKCESGYSHYDMTQMKVSNLIIKLITMNLTILVRVDVALTVIS